MSVRDPLFDDDSFDFTPALDAQPTANPDNTLTVTVTNNDPINNVGFIATIFDVSGSAAPSQPMDLAPQGSGNITFTGNVPIPGSFPLTLPASGTPANNKCVRVQAVRASGSGGASEDHSCFVSGSGGSEQLVLKRSHSCPHCRNDLPVHVAVRLLLDSPVRPGTCSNCDQLNSPMTLIHSADLGHPCSWFSGPITFCADGTPPAWWMLAKTDPITWTLTLNHNGKVVVTYRLTAAAKQCSFPIQLQIVGTGGKECKNWPRTVTVTV